MYNFIDTHFHLDFYKDHKQIFDELNRNQVYTLCVTNQPEIFESCINIYGMSKYVKFAIGYNPKSSIDTPFSKESFMRNISKTDYIGEVGLDFNNVSKGLISKQLDAFEFIANYSAKSNKLMTVHCKKAEEDLYRIIKEKQNRKLILHWYTGSLEWAEKFCELGCFFSVNMNMLKNQSNLEVIKKLPMNRILVESDGPFSRVNGRGYEIKYLPLIYDELARVKEADNINQTIFNNFKTLLQL